MEFLIRKYMYYRMLSMRILVDWVGVLRWIVLVSAGLAPMRFVMMMMVMMVAVVVVVVMMVMIVPPAHFRAHVAPACLHLQLASTLSVRMMWCVEIALASCMLARVVWPQPAAWFLLQCGSLYAAFAHRALPRTLPMRQCMRSTAVAHNWSHCVCVAPSIRMQENRPVWKGIFFWWATV